MNANWMRLPFELLSLLLSSHGSRRVCRLEWKMRITWLADLTWAKREIEEQSKSSLQNSHWAASCLILVQLLSWDGNLGLWSGCGKQKRKMVATAEPSRRLCRQYAKVDRRASKLVLVLKDQSARMDHRVDWCWFWKIGEMAKLQYVIRTRQAVYFAFRCVIILCVVG